MVEMISHTPPEKCREVFALLSEYLDLALPPDACRPVEDHLTGCAPCIEFVESLRKTFDLCRQHEPAELPKPLGERAKGQLPGAYKKIRETQR